MPRPIVVLGSSNTDMILRVSRLPATGETLLGGTFSIAPGGKGANQAVAAARAGGNVEFIACVGRDAFGSAALADFRREHIGVAHVRQDRHASSGVALIFVDKNGENAIGVAGGANDQLTVRDVTAARKLVQNASVLLLQLEVPQAVVAAAVSLAAKAKVPIILNPAPARALPDSLLRRITVLTPNETEAAALTGWPVTSLASARRAVDDLRRRGARNVIITLGARGALVATPDTATLVPGFRVRAVDTTAAGDVFNGALATQIARGTPLLDAVRFAHAAAALSVTRLGAQPSIPREREIRALLKL